MAPSRVAVLLLAAVAASDAKALQDLKKTPTKNATYAARFQKVNAKAIARAMSMTAPNPSLSSGTDPCAAFTTEAQCQDNVEAHTDGCVWALPHGGQADWEDEEDEVCRPMRCHDIESMQMSGDEAVGCATFLGAGHCTFNEDSYICWETGQTLDCEYRNAWEASMCPSPQCTWDANLYRCGTAGVPEPCGEYYDSAGCNNAQDCRWVAGDENYGCSVCYNSTRFQSGVPCEAYFTKMHQCCPSDGCTWQVVMEPETDIPGEVEDGDGRCISPNAVVSCEQYEDGADCNAHSDRCHFVEMGEDGYGLCVGNGNSVPCRELDGFACVGDDSCYWTPGTTEEPGMDSFDGACSDCPPNQNCEQSPLPTDPDNPNGGEDDGRPCAEHTEMNCPVDGFPPRCSVHYPDGEDDAGTDYNDWQCAGSGSGFGTCGDPICEDAYEQGECTQQNGCSWNEGCQVCYNSSAGSFPCDRCYDQSSCGGTSNACSWQTPSGGCSVDGNDGGACVTSGGHIPCKSIQAESASCCPSYCTFDSTNMQCVDSNFQKSCASFGSDSAACPSDRCTVSKGICVDQGTTLQCSDICNAFLCSSAGGCHWDKSSSEVCADGDGPQIVCSNLQENDCYENEQCAFIGGQCQDAVCSDIFSQDVCGARAAAPYNCAWHDATGCYFSGEDLPCEHYYDDSSCPSDRCHYDSSCFRCMDTGEQCPCHYFYQQSDCPSDRCDWISNQYTCELKSDEVVPPITGGGDHDKTHCTAQQKSQLGAVLDAALDDCEDYSGSATATDAQVKCLYYYLQHASPAASFSQACPCLYWWAEHVDPERGYWMGVNC